MIICQIITTLVYGGAERLLVNFSNILVDHHELHIIYLKEEPKLKPFLHEKIKVHFVPIGLDCAREIRRLVRSLNPDVVHTHLGHADLIGMWACRGLTTKLFCTMHNVYFRWNWTDKIIFKLYYLAFQTFAKRCHVSCISSAVANHVKTKLGVNSDHVSINYNAIPTFENKYSKILAREILGIGQHDYILLAIGRLRVQKSIDTLIRAIPYLNEISNLKVLIVGEGELRSKLEKLTFELGVNDKTIFCGVTSTPELYFSAGDVFILPSVFEGLPTVIIEAFRASLPIVASDIDGTNELILHKKNGVLFESRNAMALAQSVLTLYGDPIFARQIAEAGNLDYKTKYNIKNYASQMEALYQS